MGELPPLLTPQGPGVPRARRPGFPRVDDSGTSCSSFVIFRLMIDLPFIRRIRFRYFVSAFPFTSRYWLLHGSPRPCCLVFPLVSFPFLASGYLCLVPHLHDPGLFSAPYAHVSLQLLSRSPLRFLQFLRFIRRDLCVHRRSSPPRDPFVSRFYRLGFEARFLWPASRAEAPSHHSPGAAKNTG